jgi:hypothetical protein
MDKLQYAKVARISYLLDVGRINGESITLGMIVLLHPVDRAQRLVLLCRARLDEQEHARMDWIAQQMLADPARFFANEIDAARNAGVPDLFTHLAQTFAWSIYVAPAAYVPIPSELVQDLSQALDMLAADAVRTAPPPREIIEVRPPDSAAAALARITGPEFPSGELIALLPPAWMIGDAVAGPIGA